MKKFNNVQKKKIVLSTIIIIGLISLLIFKIILKAKGTNLSSNTNSERQLIGTEKPLTASCTRTTRLENKPQYDRALSLIEEKYKHWELYDGSYGTWYFFPSQLTNCIKIIETNAREESGVEGYFVFNSKEIKDNYYPVFVDENYDESDDFLTALLLVHEITHVRQYLDTLNGVNNLSCIDMEVEAFDAAWGLYRIQSGETGKSINLRLEFDNELHPQLQVIKAIKDYYSTNPRPPTISELCDGFPGTDSECITFDRKKRIRAIISKDEYYIKQCNL